MTSPRDPDDSAPDADGGAPPPQPGLRVVSFRTQPSGTVAEPDLVREYKGPTVARVVRGAAAEPPLLPGRICTVLDAIQRGELGVADRRLDAAINVLPGPGHVRRSAWRIWWPWLVMWLGAALVTGAVLCR